MLPRPRQFKPLQFAPPRRVAHRTSPASRRRSSPPPDAARPEAASFVEAMSLDEDDRPRRKLRVRGRSAFARRAQASRNPPAFRRRQREKRPRPELSRNDGADFKVGQVADDPECLSGSHQRPVRFRNWRRADDRHQHRRVEIDRSRMCSSRMRRTMSTAGSSSRGRFLARAMICATSSCDGCRTAVDRRANIGDDLAVPRDGDVLALRRLADELGQLVFCFGDRIGRHYAARSILAIDGQNSPVEPRRQGARVGRAAAKRRGESG